MSLRWTHKFGLIAGGLLLAGVASAAPATVLLEDMTTAELRQRLDSGDLTQVIVPVGGTEQSGPHLTLGKHNARVLAIAQRLAADLGHTVVAPVMAYVPEGSVQPPSGHMRFAGTLSIPTPVFEGVLEAAARSLCAHGFRQVFLLGDHGDYQRSLTNVAQKLARGRSGDCRVHAIGEYYRASQDGFKALLRTQGFGDAEIGIHAGLADTSLSMAVAPQTVRAEALSATAAPGTATGVVGDPRRSSAELGRAGVQRIVDETLRAMRRAVSQTSR